jgi:hypothetical protein
VSDVRIINKLSRKDLEESVRSLPEVLYLNLPRGIEENHKTQDIQYPCLDSKAPGCWSTLLQY